MTWARKNIYIIKTLREFTYIDEDGRDVGNNGELSHTLRVYLMLITGQFEFQPKS